MNFTYTPKQCQAAHALEDDIIDLSASVEELEFLLNAVDDKVFEPVFSEENLNVLAYKVKHAAPGITLALDCLYNIKEVLERMNQGIRQSEAEEKTLCADTHQNVAQRA